MKNYGNQILSIFVQTTTVASVCVKRGSMRRSTRDRRLRNRSLHLPKDHHVSDSQRNNDIYDPEAIPQFFQISVNVLEARKLAWSNPQAPTSYVMVVLGRKKHRTTVRKSQEDPCFGEYLIFDMYMSIREIRRASLWLVVMEPKCYAPPRMLGEATIDLVTVWNLPSHQMYHKWLQLSLPKESDKSCHVGFLRVDVSVIPRGGVQVMPATVSEDRAADHLLLATGSEQQPARYIVTVHAGLALTSSQPQNDRRYGKGSSTYVRVTFCSVVGKTSIQKNTNDPRYNEQISIVEMFPNSNQVIKFEVCLADISFNRVIACAELKLGDVSHDGDNDKGIDTDLALDYPLLKCESNVLDKKAKHHSLTNHEVSETKAYNLKITDSFHRMKTCVEKEFHEIYRTIVLPCDTPGNTGFLPAFGPSLLHMYSVYATTASSSCPDDGPFHKGALLVSLKTVVPYYLQSLRTVSVEPVAQIYPDQLWVQEECFSYCLILEISMLDQSLVRKMTGVAMTIGEIPSERQADEEYGAVSSYLRSGRFHYTGSLEISDIKSVNGFVNFTDGAPVLQLCTRLPDFRFRMYRNNIILRIVTDLEQNITNIEKRLHHYDYTNPSELMDELNRAIDDAAGNILKFLDIVNYSSNCSASEDSMQHYATELDQKQLSMQKEEIEKVYELISKKCKGGSLLIISRSLSRCCTLDSLAGTRKGVKFLLADVKTVAERLRNTIFKTPDGWPDMIIWLLHEGSRIAYKRIKISETIYSVIPEQCGLQNSKIQTIYLKPIKCPKHGNSSATCVCIAGKMEVLLWTGLFRQRHAFGSCLPAGFHCRTKNFDVNVETATMMLESRAFIYRAKLINEGTRKKPYNAFVRINALRCSKDSQVKKNTSMPVWNQVLKIRRLVYGTHDRLYDSPPYVLVEVYNENIPGSVELLGRFQIQPVVEDRHDYAPKLQWYEIFKGSQRTGQIMMSVQFLPIPEQMVKNTVYFPVAESYYASEGPSEDNKDDDVETLPAGLVPHVESYKADVYWWGLRDVNITRKPLVVLEIDDMIIKSDIITNKKSNCNFPNGKMSQVFESPLSDDYFPTLSIKLYDSSTFGRTLFLGTNIIKHPNKFLIEWLPKNERNTSLKSVSIISSDFCDVGGEMLYIKRRKSLENNEECQSTPSLISASATNTKLKNPFITMFFKKKEPKEEELTLLPTYVKENDQIKVVKKMAKCEYGDWWTRFLLSERLNPHEEIPSDYITIYDYELEFQPEFSKFKDWCSTLKLYNGKKTGIPEKDEQLQCGYLKAGIVIYRWPPPQNTVVVAYNGVQLDKGFFGDYPDNEPTKYIVRVYVVKGINLHTIIAGKADPYVIVNCGKRQLGDRKNHVSNTTNPIFGKLYEFSCSFPEDYSVKISVYDYDSSPPDELIGSTSIDLEDRVFSKHRARVGLSLEYMLSGPSKWRDNTKPSAILNELCTKNHIAPPEYPNANTVLVNGVEYKDSPAGFTDRAFSTQEERKENICLSILHKWQTLPLVGYQLVPEHVETRSLYHTDTPGFERGKIQLWVDVFPLDKDYHVPHPRNITPRKTEEYELRVIVWDVRNALTIRENKSWKTADLYVKVWIGSMDNAQQTDIHHNSLSGEGNFNWRMVFHFLYYHNEKKIVIKEKCPFTEYEEYGPPVLHVQVIQSNEDEIIGVLTLDLSSMYKGSQSAKDCVLEAKNKGKNINLFALKSTRAWWSLKNVDDDGNTVSAGVIDLEMTLLPRERAILMPVGVGRAAPMPLPEPTRGYGVFRQIEEYIACRGREIFIIMTVIAIVSVVYVLFEAIPRAHKYMVYTLKDIRHSDPCRRNSQGIIRTILDSIS